MKRCILTGITGQVCSYLAELLLKKGWEVHGIVRRSSNLNTQRIDHLYKDPHEDTRLFLHFGDLTDGISLSNLVHKIKPDIIFNLAAQSHVKVSFENPIYTENVVATGVLRLLEVVRGLDYQCKLYQASCYSSDTRIFTPGGLKTYREVKGGDLVFTLNSNGIMECKPIRKVIIQQYDGDMVHFKSRRFDFLVTPNHKMLVKNGSNITYIDANKLKGYIKYERVSPIVLPNAVWEGDSVLNINFGEHVDFNAMNHNTTKNLLRNMAAHDYLFLLGIYIGDGYTTVPRNAKRYCCAKEFIKKKDNNGRFTSHAGMLKEAVRYNSSYIYFAVPDTDNARPKILRILEKYNIKYKAKKGTIEFSSYPLAKMFKQSGDNVYEKHIPKWVLELSSDLLSHLFDGLIDSDGYTRKIVHENHNYTTVSNQLYRDMIELIIKIGRVPKLSKLKEKSPFYIRDKRYIASGKAYGINANYKTVRKIYKENISTTHYNGEVWCLEVEGNHNFLVERNGQFMFSGNSSELYGNSPPLQSESTPMIPLSPYAVAKYSAYLNVINYRNGYGIFASNGILFNTESPRRGETFVTRKVTKGVAKIALGKENKLYLGNLEAKRDWMYAPEAVEAIYNIMQLPKPEDIVIGTGETHSVQEFVEEAFKYVGLNWEDYVVIDKKYYRPTEVNVLQADITKAKELIGWEPKVKFKELVRIMVDADLRLVERE